MVNWSTVETPLEEITYIPPTEWEILSTANSILFNITRLKGEYSLRNYLDFHDANELNRSMIVLKAMVTAHGLVADENGKFTFAK